MGAIKANKGSNTISLLIGILVIIIGVIGIAGGAAILVFNKSADAEGYHWSNTYEVRTSAHAFTLEMGSLSTVSYYSRLGTNLFGADNAVQAKWAITPLDSSRDLFTGLSTASEGNNYVSEIETEGAVWSMDGPFKPQISITSLVLSGEGLGGPVKSPFGEDIWSRATLGGQAADIEYQPVWNTRADDKYLVIMNNDGTKNVNADIQLGFIFPVFRWLPYRLIPLGALICIGGILLVRKKRA